MSQLASQLIYEVKKRNKKLNEAERALKKSKLDSFPTMIQIELTNRCNLQCLTCARAYYDEKKNPPGDFPPELFEKLDMPFAFADTVLFGGYGEPLMGEHFQDLYTLAKDYQCRTEIITNGTLLDDSMVEFLCGLGLDKIIFSVDAASDIEMMSLRGVTLTDILDKIELIKTVAGLNAPQLAFNFTLTINNLEHLKPLVSLAASQHVPDIYVAHQKIYTPAQEQDSAFHHRYHTQRVFDEVSQLATEQKVSIHLPPLEDTALCNQPLELMMIAHDGRVQGCCSALFNGGYPKLALGSLQDSELIDLWNHPLMEQARLAAYGLGEWPADCEGCAFRVFELESHLRYIGGDDQ